MISVIIPAHDEGSTIQRCLESLLTGAEPGELEVVVACNGCTDDTKDRALAVGGPVTVVETEVASKTAALNLGDAAATGFPRFFVDADVLVDIATLRAVAAVLDNGDALVAAPGLDLDTSRSSPLVRSYYRLWVTLPSVRDDVAGRGVFGMSREGRERFTTFPEIIADDHFVRTSFRPDERRSIPEVTSTVYAPRSTKSLVRRRVRVLLGNREVSRQWPDRQGSGSLRPLLGSLRQRPALITSVPAFLVVTVASRIAARRNPGAGWGRDDSRDAPVPAAAPQAGASPPPE